MSRRGPEERAGVGLTIVVVVAALVVVLVQASLAIGVHQLLDRREEVSALRLDAAMKSFRAAPHQGLAKPLEARAFVAAVNPRADPRSCAPLTALATDGAVDGRSWTGAGEVSLAPVTLLTVRFADPGAARAELARKRWAMLRCSQVAVSFPPFDAPPVTYTVSGQRWKSSAAGRRAHWTLDGGGRTFAFYVVRYGNTLTWTYDDNAVSTSQNREAVADDLVEELRDLAKR